MLTDALRGLSAEQLEALRAKERMVDRYPTLVPHRMAQYDELESLIRTSIAERSGADPETDAFPRLIAGAATAAVKTAIRVWDNTDGEAGAIAELVDQAFLDLEAGLSSED